MRRVVLTVIALGLAACGQPSTKHAETAVPSNWTDPSGRVTLTIPADWHEVDAANAPGGASGNELIIIAPIDRTVIAQCDLYTVTQQVAAPATRQLLNEATDQFRNGPEMQAYIQRGNVTRTELTDVNGVRVLDVRLAPPSLSRIERRFFFANNGMLELYTLGCAAPADDQAARLAANSVANGLEIRDN
jgi:hypothetical protein